jgi:hypothetical protein
MPPAYNKALFAAECEIALEEIPRQLEKVRLPRVIGMALSDNMPPRASASALPPAFVCVRPEQPLSMLCHDVVSIESGHCRASAAGNTGGGGAAATGATAAAAAAAAAAASAAAAPLATPPPPSPRPRRRSSPLLPRPSPPPPKSLPSVPLPYACTRASRGGAHRLRAMSCTRASSTRARAVCVSLLSRFSHIVHFGVHYLGVQTFFCQSDPL